MATLPTAASSWLDMLAGVICESKRIVTAHPYHFLALFVLFLLPLSFLAVAAPSLTTFSPHSLPPSQSLLRHSFPFPSATDATLALSLAYAMAALLVALSAASSVRRGFFGHPVKLLPALHSLPAPLACLLLTLLASLLPLAALLLLLSSLLLLTLHALSLLHLPQFFPLAYSFATITILSLIYFQLQWSLAGLIAKMESNWGLGPLRRSTYPMWGMRWAVLCLYMFFAIGIVVTLWLTSLWRPEEKNRQVNEEKEALSISMSKKIDRRANQR